MDVVVPGEGAVIFFVGMHHPSVSAAFVSVNTLRGRKKPLADVLYALLVFAVAMLPLYLIHRTIK